MIGSRFLELYSHQIEGLVTLDYPEFDLIRVSEEEIVSKLSSSAGDTLIHFAGFTNVDAAESQHGDTTGSCWQLNVEATKKLVKACQKLNLKIVYISTDFVFGGDSGPYSEEGKVAGFESEISWYGWTKLVGEEAVKDARVDFLIVRTSYPFRANFSGKADFVRNIIERFKNNNLYPLFYDQFLTPTFVDDFVKALDLLIREDQQGTWHVVDNTTLSAFDAAVVIAKVFGFDNKKIQKTSILEFGKKNPTAAKRPVAGGLKNDKLRKFLRTAAQNGVDMQDFGQALVEMKKQMKGNGQYQQVALRD